MIDEAGQALPQHAAGAIWRARRAVVVGDPLQLEPISSISFKVQEALRQHHGVDKIWAPARTSVQRLADRISIYGTTVKNAESKNWVGTPLRVHRRCIPPMMQICNTIAYNRLMVDGTHSKPYIKWPSSQWIDVKSTTTDGHWVEAEGEATAQLLEELISLDADPTQIFLISPFRAVVDQLRFFKASFKGIQAGTVHTTQGKETDIVVLVLGSNPSSQGARQWASSKPNLLNVAVSRSKLRLYVIGDRSKWQQHNYFSTYAAQLEKHAKSERVECVEMDYEL